MLSKVIHWLHRSTPVTSCPMRQLLLLATTATLFAASSADASFSSSWSATCSNSNNTSAITQQSAQCGDTPQGATFITGWSTSSPDGALRTVGHERSASGLRTFDQLSAQGEVGLLSANLTSTATVLSGAPTGFSASARNNLSAQFRDQISVLSIVPGAFDTTLRFTLILDANVVATAAGTRDNGWSSRTLTSSQLSLSGFGTIIDQFETCVGAIAGATLTCTNIQSGLSQVVVSADVVVRAGAYTGNLTATLSSFTEGVARAQPAGLLGDSQAAAEAQLRLYIEPLDPRVYIEAASGFNYAPVPETATWAMFVGGLCFLGLISQRKLHL